MDLAKRTLLEERFRRAALREFENMNLDPMPWFRFRPNSGTLVNIAGLVPSGRSGLRQFTLTCPIKTLGGYVNIKSDWESYLRRVARQWGHIARPRNHYFLETMKCTVDNVYGWIEGETIVTWKLYFAVLPRSWRRKLWRKRMLARDHEEAIVNGGGT